jgi:hypothetical protein
LDEAAQEAAAAALRVELVHHDRRAAPFPAERQPLHDAQQDEQDGREDADGGVGGQQADEEGGEPHHQQRDHEDRLAPDPVAVMAEDGRAHGPRHEGDAVARQREQHRGQRVRLGEEQLREDQRGGGAVDEVVVELQRRAGEARAGDLRGGGPPRPRRVHRGTR